MKKTVAALLALLMLLTELPLPVYGLENEDQIPPDSQQTAELPVETDGDELIGEIPGEPEHIEEVTEENEAGTEPMEEAEDAQPPESTEEPEAQPDEKPESTEEPEAQPDEKPESTEEPEVQPEEEPEVIVREESLVYINPLYRELLDEDDLIQTVPQSAGRRRLMKAAAAEEKHYAASLEEAADILRAGLKQHQTTIPIYYQTKEKPVLADLNRQITGKALEHTGVPTEGDYLKWQYGGWRCNLTHVWNGAAYDCTITFLVTYYTTASEEQQVDERIQSLRSELGLSGKSDYEKVKAIYDYITRNVSYDYNYGDKQAQDNFHSYTAYGALMDHTAVCQGYALLLYRLLLEEGIDCRIITGKGGSEIHTWNIVRLGSVYYNLDATWDAGKSPYAWFLKSDADFVNHVRSGQTQDDIDRGYVYNDAAFYAAYPMSPRNYGWLDTPELGGAACDNYGVTLRWKPVSGAEQYRVWQQTGDGGWSKVLDTAATSALIPSVSEGRQYTFTVSCIDHFGNEISGKPEGLNVRYQLICLQTPEMKKPENADGGVRVSWNAVDGANWYQVLYRTEGGSWQRAGDVQGTSYVVKGLKSGTKYAFTVGCVSDNKAYFTSLYHKTGQGITYIAAPVIKTISAGNGKISLSWGKVAGAAKYRVFYRTGSGKWTKLADTTSTKYTTQKLAMGKAYTFTVRCIASNGKRYTSAYNGGRKIENAATPKLTAISAGNGKVSLSWGKVQGAAKYRVFYQTGGGKWKQLGDTKGTKFTTLKLTMGKTYRFTVRCVTAEGSSYSSAYHSKGLSIANLDTPKIKTKKASGGKVTLSWSNIKGAAQYRVFYKTGSGGWKKLGDTKSTRFTTPKLTKGKTYAFTVRCVSSDGKLYTSAYQTKGVNVKVK